jgi:hypothetical protein
MLVGRSEAPFVSASRSLLLSGMEEGEAMTAKKPASGTSAEFRDWLKTKLPKAKPPARHVPREFMRTGLDDGPLLPVPASEPRDEHSILCSEGQYAGDQVMPCDCDGPEPPATLPLPVDLRDRVIEAMEHLSVCVSWTPRLDSICDRCKSARAVLAELRALGGDRG